MTGRVFHFLKTTRTSRLDAVGNKTIKEKETNNPRNQENKLFIHSFNAHLFRGANRSTAEMSIDMWRNYTNPENMH